MTSASLLIVLIVGLIVGALTGLLASGFLHGIALAVLAGFLATIIAGAVRNLILAKGSGLGPDDSRTPWLVILYSAIASLGGSSAAMELDRLSFPTASPVWVGTLAGLFSCIILSMLMVTYHTMPGQPPMPRSHH